jgi:diadenosine tetraphosphate (Ap4A) HIT family hydrolase
MTRSAECPFCELSSQEVILHERAGAVWMLDAKPLVEGHSLLVTTGHARSVLDANASTQSAMSDVEDFALSRYRAAYGEAIVLEHGRGRLCSFDGVHLGPRHAHRHVFPFTFDPADALTADSWTRLVSAVEVPLAGHYFYFRAMGRAAELFARVGRPPSHLVRRVVLELNPALRAPLAPATAMNVAAARKLRKDSRR